MSQQLINRSPDLKRLRDEGYDIEIRSGHLLAKNIPYVNSNKDVKLGTLVTVLTLAGDITTRPDTHVAFFAGEYPCTKDGAEIVRIKSGSNRQQLAPDLEVHHSFSSKPLCGHYSDYYEKITTYVSIISNHAQSIDPTVSAMTFPTIEPDENDSMFNYIDTASSRAGISAMTSKLELGRVAIVGLGGTGSYIFDLIAKTPVKEINIFDGDKFSQHNAFRSPGAPSVEELRGELQKVDYFGGLYSKMHRNIIIHDCYMDSSNINQLNGMDFVFICLDKNDVKKSFVEKLDEFGIPFIDVGMGVDLVDDKLFGILRVTTSTQGKRDHIKGKNRISFTDGDADDDYKTNIQIAELNALNAALAVIKWKKLFGFYGDLEKEHFSAYTIDGNHIINEDQA